MSPTAKSISDVRRVFCHCTYAKVIPQDVKREVLAQLCASEIPFEAVADLCEMSARKDPALKRIASGGPTAIVACYPRAVKWLFHAGDAPLPDDGVELMNMREREADAIVSGLLEIGTSTEEAHGRT